MLRRQLRGMFPNTRLQVLKLYVSSTHRNARRQITIKLYAFFRSYLLSSVARVVGKKI